MFYFYDALRLTVRAVVRFTNDRMEDGFYWTTERFNDASVEEGEYALPIKTDDLRQTSIIATGYEWDTEAWVEDINEAASNWLNTWAAA